MQTEIVMPALSPAMTHGTIAKWHVAEGQTVAVGDVIAEIETATETLEIEASDRGRVEKILVPAGTTGVRVNTPIALIRAEYAALRATTDVRLTELPSKAQASSLEVQAAAAAPAAEQSVLSYREALGSALAEEMRRDASVFLIGVDLAQNSGAEKVSRGLLDEFGPERVVTAPPLEDAFTGLAVGAALAGLRPVVEFRSWAIGNEAAQHIIAVAASLAQMTAGRVTVPIVFRAPDGPTPGGAGPQSRCAASLLAAVPGLAVLAPATPADAKGLLKAALRGIGPVAILEHELLYAAEGPVPSPPDWIVPIGKARCASQGHDLTIVSYGRAVVSALEASGELARTGVSAEVIDLRSLRPLDLDTVLASVAKTRRLLVVEDGPPVCSVGSEIVGRVAERAFAVLAAPPRRVSGRDSPQLYAEALERLASADPAAVVETAKAVIAGK